MYPTDELKTLDTRKAEIRRRISLSRVQCVEASGGLKGTLDEIDRAWSLWQRVAPVAKLAVSSLSGIFPQTRTRGLNLVGTVARWAPFVFKTVRGLAKKKPDEGV